MNREQEELTIRLKSVDVPKDIQLTFDDDKLDLDTNYRIELNNRIKKLIQHINIVREDVSKSKYTIYCTIKYWTDVISHGHYRCKYKTYWYWWHEYINNYSKIC